MAKKRASKSAEICVPMERAAFANFVAGAHVMVIRRSVFAHHGRSAVEQASLKTLAEVRWLDDGRAEVRFVGSKRWLLSTGRGRDLGMLWSPRDPYGPPVKYELVGVLK